MNSLESPAREATMAWKQDSDASFSGASGQMAVIAELLHRKCNAAIPHIDVGTDVFAFRDDREEVARIQVKTETAEPYKKGEGFSAKFGIPMEQLRRTDAPPLFYALAVRLDGRWACFLILSRAALKELWNDGLGSENKKSGDLELYIQFRPEKATDDVGTVLAPNLTAKYGTEKTKVFDLTVYLHAWETLPPLMRPVPLTAAEQARSTDVAEVHIEDLGSESPRA